ncbi:MAG: hypothetical protein AB7K86_23690, partial [Rhodospirillales bacterium]
MDTGTENFRELPIKQMDRRTSTSDVLVHAARQARDRKLEDYLVIDVDAHHFETESWKEVIEYIEDPVVRDIGKSMERLDGT